MRQPSETAALTVQAEIYSQTSMARTPLEPRKDTGDRGSSS